MSPRAAPPTPSQTASAARPAATSPQHRRQQLRELDDRPGRRPARAGRRRAAPRPRPDRRAGRRGPRAQRHQHHRHGRALRRHPARHGPRRRQPRLPLRDGELPQLTNDHTFVQSLIDEGRITEEEARVHPHRNLILKALDGVARGRARPVRRRPRGRATGIFLCSDGACGVLDDARIADILATRHPRLRRGRAGPRQPRGRQHRQRHLRRRRRRRRPTPTATTPSRCWSAPPPSCRAGGRGAGAAASSAATAPATPASSSRSPPRSPRTRLRHPRRPDRPRGRPLRPAAAPPLHLAQRLLALLVLLGLVWVAWPRRWSWSQQQYYVGEHDGRSPIYRGLNADLPGRRALHPYETTDVAVDDLSDSTPTGRRDGIDAGDLDDARATVDNLAARQDAAHRDGHRADGSQDRRPHGLRAPAPPRRGALPARARPGGRHRRLRRRRPRRRGQGPGRHRRVRRLAGRARHRRPHRGPPRRAVRRPGAAARRRRPQRPRPGGHPPARPRHRRQLDTDASPASS